MHQTIRQVFRFWVDIYKENSISMWIAIIATSCSAVVALVVPRVTGGVLDSLSSGESVISGVVRLVILSIAMAMLDIAGARSVTRIGENGVQVKRLLYARAVAKLPIARHHEFSAGDLLSRMTSDTSLIKYLCAMAITELVSSSLLAIGALSFMLLINPQLFFISIVPLVLSSTIMVTAARSLKKLRTRTQESTALLSSVLQSSIAGALIFHSFGVAEFPMSRLQKSIAAVRDAGIREGLLQSTVSPVSQAIGGLSLAVVFLFGGWQTVNGVITIGTLISCVLYISLFIPSVMSLNQTWIALQQCLSSLVRVDEICGLGTEPEPVSSKRGDSSRGDIAVALDGVYFSYAGSEDAQILSNVSISLKRGERIAIQGFSGTGKTTLLSIIAGQNAPTNGRVEVHGSLSSPKDTASRRLFGIVDQSAYVFAGTLRENLIFDDMTVNDETLYELLDSLCIGETVRSRQDGLATVINDSGEPFSRGQQQRIAIARALLAGAEILLFDEPTSNLDAVTDRAVWRCVQNFAPEATVVAVMHSLRYDWFDREFLLVDGVLQVKADFKWGGYRY